MWVAGQEHPKLYIVLCKISFPSWGLLWNVAILAQHYMVAQPQKTLTWIITAMKVNLASNFSSFIMFAAVVDNTGTCLAAILDIIVCFM